MSESQEDFTTEDFEQRKKELEIERLELENERIREEDFREQNSSNLPKGSGFGIAALVLGILSLLGGWVCGVLAIIFAQIVLKDPDSSFEGYRHAKTGKITGIIGIIVWSIIFAIFTFGIGLLGLFGLLGLLAGGPRPVQHR